ncbi:MAG: serine/threonine protein kinase [Archangium sp.]|nr:serine/threonine protein kinase [Archangium sp.]
MSTPLPQLSRYEVLGRLATGGMAEVWLARALGVAGFEKLVVVKTILPNLANDPSFVTMFVNEGRLAARLNHPNCVQIFDLGHENGVLYLAMEYIEGFSLSRLLKRAKEKNLPPGEKILARIAMDAASGLDYAHRLTDRDGTQLHLVHRDVSPDNLLVSLSGQTRLVDFGIAKAATPTLLASATTAGTVKGKHGFIAPEYLLGNPIDGRADLFALGVVMYRALTRKRPFNGVNEAAVSLAVIQDRPVAPHELAPEVSAALSSVVMMALEKDPNTRFESARAMRQAIEVAVGRPADQEEVGDYMQQLWPPGDAERTALSELASGASEERSGPALRSVVSGTWAGQGSPTATGGGVVVHATPPTAEELTKALLQPTARRSRDGLPAVQVTGGPLLSTPSPAPQPLPAAAVAPMVSFDSPPPQPTPKGKSSLGLIVVGMLVVGVGSGVGWQVWKMKQPSVIVLPPPTNDTPPAGATEGTLVFEGLPIVAHVFDGKDDLGATPLTLKRPAGALTLRLVNKAAGLDQTLKLNVEAGATTTINTLARGTLVVKADPWAYVKVDGKSYGQTPVTVKGLFEGPHFVELNNVGLNETRKRTVKVQGGETKSLSVNLLEEEDE